MTAPKGPDLGVSRECAGSVAADGKAGVVAELVQAVAGDVAAAKAEPEQLAMFEAPAGELLIAGSNAAIAEERRMRGAGRPPGAQNKATRELREWLLAKGIVPQHWQMKWLMLEPEALAARLRCTVAEAFDRQAALARELGPYLMAKMAPTDAAGNAVPGVVLSIGGEPVNQDGSGAVPWGQWFRPRGEQYQGLTIEGDAQSQDALSQAEEKP